MYIKALIRMARKWGKSLICILWSAVVNMENTFLLQNCYSRSLWKPLISLLPLKAMDLTQSTIMQKPGGLDWMCFHPHIYAGNCFVYESFKTFFSTFSCLAPSLVRSRIPKIPPIVEGSVNWDFLLSKYILSCLQFIALACMVALKNFLLFYFIILKLYGL